MRVLAVGVTEALVAYVRKRMPAVEVDVATGRDSLQSLQERACSLLILGSEDSGAKSLEVLRVVRDVFDADTLPVIYLLPADADREASLKQATVLRPHHMLMQQVEPEDLVQKSAELLGMSLPRPPLPPVARTRGLTNTPRARNWTEQQAVILPRLEVLERSAQALDSGLMSTSVARSGAFEAERLRQFLSENWHETGIAVLSQLAPLFRGAAPGSVSAVHAGVQFTELLHYIRQALGR